MIPLRLGIVPALAAMLSCVPAADGPIREAVTFYASFDKGAEADFGAHPEPRLEFEGAAPLVAGAHGRALRIDNPGQGAAVSYPAQGNLPDPRAAWSGTVSFWFQAKRGSGADAVQTLVSVTTRCGSPGGLRVEYVAGRPPELRLGASSAQGGEARPQPAVVAQLRDRAPSDWRHVAVTWANFDSGRSNAWVALYLDGDMAGTVTNATFRSGMEAGEGSLCVGENYQGAIDELAVLSRPLSQKEIRRLFSEPALLAVLKDGPRRRRAAGTETARNNGWFGYPAFLGR